MILRFPIIPMPRRTAQPEDARAVERRGQPASPPGTNASSAAPCDEQDITKGGADDMTVSTPEQIMLDGTAVPQATRAQRIALSILQGEHLYPAPIGHIGFSNDLTHESCLLCGGFFPKVGEARHSAVFHGYLHTGCVADAPNWADPLVPLRMSTTTCAGCSHLAHGSGRCVAVPLFGRNRRCGCTFDGGEWPA